MNLQKKVKNQTNFFVNWTGDKSIDNLSARDVAIASSIAKIFASTLTYPHEVQISALVFFRFDSVDLISLGVTRDVCRLWERGFKSKDTTARNVTRE